MEKEKKDQKILIVDDGPDSESIKKFAEQAGMKAELVQTQVNGDDYFPKPEPPKPIEIDINKPKPTISRKQLKKYFRLAAHRVKRNGNALPCEKTNAQIRRERKAAELAAKDSK